MSETHISKDIDYGNAFYVAGYDFVSRERSTAYGGGVAAYIHEGMNWKRRVDLEDEFIECICLEIFSKKSKSFMAVVIYRPPDSSKHVHEDFNQRFSNVLSLMADKETIIMGDVNADFLSKNTNTELKLIFKLYGFEQLIEKPCRIDGEAKSLIDIFATNHAAKIRKTDVIPSGIADDWSCLQGKQFKIPRMRNNLPGLQELRSTEAKQTFEYPRLGKAFPNYKCK